MRGKLCRLQGYFERPSPFNYLVSIQRVCTVAILAIPNPNPLGVACFTIRHAPFSRRHPHTLTVAIGPTLETRAYSSFKLTARL